MYLISTFIVYLYFPDKLVLELTFLTSQHIADDNNYHLLSIYYVIVHVLTPLVFIDPYNETLLSTTEDQVGLHRNLNRPD